MHHNKATIKIVQHQGVSCNSNSRYNNTEVILLKFNPRDRHTINKTIRLDEDLVKKCMKKQERGSYHLTSLLLHV